MTTTTLDPEPILEPGRHPAPEKSHTPHYRACLMEVASLLAGEEWTDQPACVHPLIAAMSRRLNDHLGTKDRQALLALLPTLMGTPQPADTREAEVLSVRLAVWCARQATRWARPQDRPVCEAAAAAAEGWCEGRVTVEACRAAATTAAGTAAACLLVGGDGPTGPYDYTRSHLNYEAVMVSVRAAKAAGSATHEWAIVRATYATGCLFHAARHAGADPETLTGLLTGLVGEYDRLTGRTTPTAPTY